MLPADPRGRAPAQDELAYLLPRLRPVIAVDPDALRRWLLTASAAGGYGLATSWQPGGDDVADLVADLEASHTDAARQAWRLSPAVTQTFAVRLSGGQWLFGADTVHGGRVCASPRKDADLLRRAPGAGADAAVAAVGHIAALVDDAWRRTVSSLWTVAEPDGVAFCGPLSGFDARSLLHRIALLPPDDLEVPDGLTSVLSYNALRARALVRDFLGRESPGAENFEAYQRWRDDVGGDGALVGDLMKRFPNTPIAVLAGWARRDERAALAAVAGTDGSVRTAAGETLMRGQRYRLILRRNGKIRDESAVLEYHGQETAWLRFTAPPRTDVMIVPKGWLRRVDSVPQQTPIHLDREVSGEADERAARPDAEGHR